MSVAAHHADEGHSGDSHFFPDTGNEHHYAWRDQDLSTPDTIDLFYDFRPQNGYANRITPGQTELAERAVMMWTEASGGRLHFSRSTTAPREQIINIGTGNMRAMGPQYSSRRGGLLGLGGGEYSDDGTYRITEGIAWLDLAENWDEHFGNGDVDGTFDYFTTVAHEIGHALGLGHTDDLSGRHLMDGQASGEMTGPTDIDVEHLLVLYGEPAAPEPGILVHPTQDLVTRESRRRRRTRFSVVLTAPPTADVILTLASSDRTEGRIRTEILTFTPENWDEAQTVIVTGVNDRRRDGHISYSIVIDPASSDDPAYHGIDPEDPVVVNRDNERRSRRWWRRFRMQQQENAHIAAQETAAVRGRSGGGSQRVVMDSGGVSGLRRWIAAATSPLNIGAGRSGRLVSSGWNWAPMK